MEFLRIVAYFNLCLNAIIFILVIAFNRGELDRVRRIFEILSNGGYRDCPFYDDQLRQNLESTISQSKGGE